MEHPTILLLSSKLSLVLATKPNNSHKDVRANNKTPECVLIWSHFSLINKSLRQECRSIVIPIDTNESKNVYLLGSPSMKNDKKVL